MRHASRHFFATCIIGHDQESLITINGLIACGTSIAEPAQRAPQYADGILRTAIQAIWQL